MNTSENRTQPAPRAPGARGMPHPASVILLWLSLAIALQSLHAGALLIVGGLLGAAAVSTSASRLYQVIRRARWIMVSLLLIYGYVTPGEALWAEGGAFSPTREGLAEGMLQLGRLASALAGLSIVLDLLSQRQLIAGLYTLAYPLRFLGMRRERLAVRLALTLYYAEAATRETATGWRASVERMLVPPGIEQHGVELCVQPFRARDIILVAMGGGLLAAALW